MRMVQQDDVAETRLFPSTNHEIPHATPFILVCPLRSNENCMASSITCVYAVRRKTSILRTRSPSLLTRKGPANENSQIHKASICSCNNKQRLSERGLSACCWHGASDSETRTLPSITRLQRQQLWLKSAALPERSNSLPPRSTPVHGGSFSNEGIAKATR